jgi:hypothetical protein
MRKTVATSRLSATAIEKLIDDTCDDVRYGHAS